MLHSISLTTVVTTKSMIFRLHATLCRCPMHVIAWAPCIHGQGLTDIKQQTTISVYSVFFRNGSFLRMCAIFPGMLRLLHRDELPIDIQNNSNKYYKQMLLNSLRHNADECALPVRALCNDMHVPTSTTASFASCRILMFIAGSLQSCQPCHVSPPHTCHVLAQGYSVWAESANAVIFESMFPQTTPPTDITGTQVRQQTTISVYSFF